MEHVYDIHTLIKNRLCMLTRHYYCASADACLVLGHVTIIALFVVDVWQASFVITVGIIFFNIQEKMYYINIINSMQIYVYVFYKVLCQTWLIKRLT